MPAPKNQHGVTTIIYFLRRDAGCRMQTFVKLGKHLLGFLTFLNKYWRRVPGSVRRRKPNPPPIFLDQAPGTPPQKSKSRNPTSGLCDSSKTEAHLNTESIKDVWSCRSGSTGIAFLLTASVFCIGVAVVNSLRIQVTELRHEASSIRGEIHLSTQNVQRSMEDLARADLRLEKNFKRSETRIENLETLIMDHHMQLEKIGKLYKNLQIEFNTFRQKTDLETH